VKRLDILPIVVAVMALAMALYHLICSQVLLLSTVAHINAHLGFALIIVFLGIASESKSKIRRIWSLILGVLAFLCALYVHILWPELQDRAYFNTNLDLVIGVLLIFMSLELYSSLG